MWAALVAQEKVRTLWLDGRFMRSLSILRSPLTLVYPRLPVHLSILRLICKEAASGEELRWMVALVL
jgi:hypothetical protein